MAVTVPATPSSIHTPKAHPPRAAVNGVRSSSNGHVASRTPNGRIPATPRSRHKPKPTRTAEEHIQRDDDADAENGNTKPSGAFRKPSSSSASSSASPSSSSFKAAADARSASHKLLNTLHHYFTSFTTPSSSAPPSSSPSPSSSSTPPDVAAVLSLLSPGDANMAAQRSAMKKISRIHQQLASDIEWDPGKKRQREEDERKRREEAERTDGPTDAERGDSDSAKRTPVTLRSPQKRDQFKQRALRPADAQHGGSTLEVVGIEEAQSLVMDGSPVQAKLDLLMGNRRGRPPKLDPSLIITPSFRLVTDDSSSPSKAHVQAKKPSLSSSSSSHPTGRSSSAASSTASSPPPTPTSPSTPTLSSHSFYKRHLPHARAERRMRLQQRQESTESWIICDHCKKWRLLASSPSSSSASSSPSSSTPPQYFCGGGRKPRTEECDRLDDWIVRCVGEAKARLLSDAGVETVEGMEGSAVRADREKRMERLGMYFDRDTQKVKCF